MHYNTEIWQESLEKYLTSLFFGHDVHTHLHIASDFDMNQLGGQLFNCIYNEGWDMHSFELED